MLMMHWMKHGIENSKFSRVFLCHTIIAKPSDGHADHACVSGIIISYAVRYNTTLIDFLDTNYFPCLRLGQ